MKLDDFLADYFKEDDTVEVSARDLQDTFRLQRMYETQIEELKNERANFKREVQKLKTKLQLIEIAKPIRIDLKA